MSQSAIIRQASDLLLQDKKLTLRIERARAAIGAYSSECSEPLSVISEPLSVIIV